MAQASRAVRRLLPASAPRCRCRPTATAGWLANDDRALAHPDDAARGARGAGAGRVRVRGSPATRSWPRAGSPCDGDWAGITDVWVSPGHRRQGLGLVVLDALLEWAAERGAAHGVPAGSRRQPTGARALRHTGLPHPPHLPLPRGPDVAAARRLTCAHAWPSPSSPGVRPVVTTPAAAAAGAYRYAVITFHKNYANTFRSTLTWEVFRVTATGTGPPWSAGSGGPARASPADRPTPAAATTAGCPTGATGRALVTRLRRQPDQGPRDLPRPEALPRTAPCAPTLFIHTEQGAGSRQCPDRPGDQLCRWEYPAINDYRSYGCVKLSPGDLHELYDAWRRYFRLGSPPQVTVRVS